MLVHAVVLAMAAGYTAAQISISANCSAALLVVNNDPGASACLSPSTLVGLATGSGSTVSVIDQWLGKICPVAACSNSTLASVVNTVAGGCSNELAAAGITAPASILVSIVQQGYPTVRQVACLKDGNTNCVTETLNNIQSSTGQTITISNIVSVVSQFNNLPTNVTCTNCVKAGYSTVKQQQPAWASGLQQPLQAKCGTSFTDGAQPSGIVESASTASPATSSKSAARADMMDLSSSIPVIASLALSSLVAFGSTILIV
ncbi:hypothetical protein AX15_006819 [Amanita polypyramis BW_CC]|nr:hypothetical protein AX15_006819 [Amanita polypyramis BW_CC]